MILAQCPQRDSLYEYSVGRLSGPQYEEVSAHLESCPECQSEITTLEDDGDTLIRQLRVPIDETFLKEPSFRAAVAQAHAIPQRLVRKRTDYSSVTPRVLGEYELLEELGRGGMGRVYRARHTKLDRIVAVKVLPRGRFESSRAIVRFEREMRAIGGLDHPHVVHAYDGREIEQMPVLVMEYVEGMDLAELVRRLGRLKPEDACELVRQAALGLQYANANGLVHRDIKPSNIMLSRDGNVKLLDLGLARFSTEPLVEEVTGAGQAMGTADYIAPEQVSDSRSADVRADIYSLGCTLYKLLVGRAPYSGPEYRGVHEKMNAHVHHPLPPIRGHIDGLPTGLVAVIERMLAKEPAERFATPDDVVEALMPLCDRADTAQLIERAERAVPPEENALAGGGVVTASTGPAMATRAAGVVNSSGCNVRTLSRPRFSIGRLLLVATVVAVLMRPLLWFWNAGGPMAFAAGFTDPWIYIINCLTGSAISRIAIRSYEYGEFGDFFQLLGWITGGASVAFAGLVIGVCFRKWWRVTTASVK